MNADRNQEMLSPCICVYLRPTNDFFAASQGAVVRVLKNPVETADLKVVGNYLDVRLDQLRSAQNPDGGWGYFRGKQSWLEPTVYAALALHGEPAAHRAWALLSRWQRVDGSWRPAADVQIANWGTALCVTLALARGESGSAFRAGVGWLLNSAGVESSLVNRTAARVGIFNAERNLSLKGWPWKPNTSSWVEPTAHTLVALKLASVKMPESDVRDRVQLGEAQLLDVRCKDGGWNYGSRAALGIDLPSYPETTALALLGLQGRSDLESTFAAAAKMARETPSPLARAWFTLVCRLHGEDALPPSDRPPIPDIVVTALEALGSTGGNYRFLKTGGAA
jgi:hypothetical protein